MKHCIEILFEFFVFLFEKFLMFFIWAHTGTESYLLAEGGLDKSRFIQFVDRVKFITQFCKWTAECSSNKSQISEESAKVFAKTPDVISIPTDNVGLLRNGKLFVKLRILSPDIILSEIHFIKIVLRLSEKT